MQTLPQMIPVKSSNVEAVGHDAAKDELHVKFQSGGHYVYEGVHRSLYNDFLAADSVTKILNSHVKGKFKHRKL